MIDIYTDATWHGGIEIYGNNGYNNSYLGKQFAL